MSGPPAHIKLTGEKAERFEELREEASERAGYEIPAPEFIGWLMAAYDTEEDVDG